MGTNTKQLIEKLSQAKKQGLYPEKCAGFIADWYARIPSSGRVSLTDMAQVLSTDIKAAAAWNKYEDRIADYFVEAVRLSDLTRTMHSLRQI